jgi:opacity protein-like surface antigen
MVSMNRDLFLTLVFPAIVAAAATDALAQEPNADFLFGRPKGSVGARGAWMISTATKDNDIYDFLTDQLTIDLGDFDAFLFGADGSFAVASRVDLVAGFEVSKASMSSEYRDFVDQNDLPILQDTRLTIVPVTLSVKLYLTPRGREVSRYAYVPSKVRPYVGGGGGFVWYELEQVGDFVDFVDLSIFTSGFHSSGWGWATQAFGGVEVGLTPRWFLSVEGRYLWSEADLGDDFVSFEPIDLSGARIGAGIGFSF